MAKTVWSGFEVDLCDCLKGIVEKRILPGVVFAAGDADGVKMKCAVGKKRSFPYEEVMTVNTVFDLASLTKVVATWAAAMKLIGMGKLRLNMRVGDIDPEMADTPVGGVSIEQLLLHTGGLSERTWLIQYGREREAIYRGICEKPLDAQPGTRVAYSNRGFILLGFLIERIAGRTLDEFVRDEVWKPAGMRNACYCPKDVSRIAPTEFDAERGEYLCGVVHDENARVLGGVAGHAGVFSDAEELCRFCRMIVRGGDGVLDGGMIEKSFKNYTPGLGGDRGYGWQQCPETARPHSLFRHFGFTGTAIWIDIVHKKYFVMLTNRVHPNREVWLEGIQTARAEAQGRIMGFLDADS